MSNHKMRAPLGPPVQCEPPQVPERFQELGRQLNLAIMGLRSLHSKLPRPPEPVPLTSVDDSAEETGTSPQKKRGGHAHRRSLEGFDASLRGMPLILRYLSEHGGSAYPSELKAATGLTQARISNALAALEARELVKRTTDGKDRRHVVVTLTKAGGRAVAERMAAMDSYAGSLLELLGESDAKELVRIIQKLSRALESQDAECRETRASAADESTGAKEPASAGKDGEGA
ncbi:MarR family winged helix-turn-helix transcriptional regulator [Leptogranulimonas caecicola]|uniref:MarR family winged helix-turn-helix transcriptional regulator n=1 Tax=Leptogranulimonas caecicola TaxID=2894156 RepID=UPI002240EF03|nr:MarR family winged helix-turn-helix transcriptional regulator [Leptogranulimonas caecicola]